MGPLFHALVTSAEGWEWVNEGRGGKEKWGLVSTQPGSVARVVLSTEESSDGGGTAGPATVVITFLRSYEHMGKMRVECGGGCGCEAAVIQGHSELRESQTAVQAISVTRAGGCGWVGGLLRSVGVCEDAGLLQGSCFCRDEARLASPALVLQRSASCG